MKLKKVTGTYPSGKPIEEVEETENNVGELIS